MIRSARVLLNKENVGEENAPNIADGENCAPPFPSGSMVLVSQPLGQRWTLENKGIGGDSGIWQSDRAQKRTGACAMLGGGGTRRLTRSRSTMDHGTTRSSENGAPERIAPVSVQASAVLGDVTNTAGFLGCSDCLPDVIKLSSTAVQDGIWIDPPTPPMLEEAEAEVDDDVDAQQATEYLPDIHRLLRRQESAHRPQPSYMDKQPHVNAKMRAILVDWLVDVHKKYKLKAETLFLAVDLVDRFLEQRSTQRQHLQLVGVTALLIAAKFEEMYPPQVQDFVYVTDKAYSIDEVTRMEVSMLNALDFQVCQPTAVHFHAWYERTNGCSPSHSNLAQYLLELTLVDYKMLRYAPSHLAAAAMLLSNKLLRRQPAWTPAMVKHTKMTEQMLKGCAREMRVIFEETPQSPLQALRKKFSLPRYHEVAKLAVSDPHDSSAAMRSVRRCASAAALGHGPPSRPVTGAAPSRSGL